MRIRDESCCLIEFNGWKLGGTVFAFAGCSTVTRLVDGIQLEDKLNKLVVLYVEENTVKFIAL